VKRTFTAAAAGAGLLLGIAGVATAQWGGWREGFVPDRLGVPTWNSEPEFERDVFTFVRIRYTSDYGGGYDDFGGFRGRRGRGGPRGGPRGGAWSVDYPASDLNFSYRLPEPRYLTLTDPELFKYPFIYLIEPGGLLLSDEEIVALRRYLENGGFLMVDDFWGEYEWDVFYSQFRRAFPDRDLVELPLSHPIFHCVYDLPCKPQIPSINQAWGGQSTGRTWEREDARTPHYKALFGQDGRMQAIVCHNTDLGDGWEREGEDPWYFHQFSEKYAYPLGINIIVYAMTH
jgi:hypothetical protein